MNKKTITKVLRRKHKEFIDSIKDEKVSRRARSRCIISGGCITSMLLNEPVNDFDYYFTDLKTAQMMADYYVGEFKKEHPDITKYLSTVVEDGRLYVTSNLVLNPAHADSQYFQSDPSTDGGLDEGRGASSVFEFGEYKPVFITSNAITLSDKVQLIVRFSGTPQEIHSNFDFAHCTNYWDSDTEELVLNQEALECTLAKQLIYTGSKYPVCSVIRTRKFIRRGWSVNAGQYLKMCGQISELNLLDIATLRDQLVGVDSVYFMKVISELKAKKKLNPNFSISMDYLSKILDRLF